ncbi:MAG: L,D-transpeptidase [Anaerolineaceae bacterium]|nr:L,D-transpeptidase [Anaerolineaceae bacterium]
MNRREFLSLSALSLAGLAFSPYNIANNSNEDSMDIGRVCIESVSIYSKPSDKSEILYQRYRNEIIHLYYDVISDDGPDYNPRWYRVWGGYVHSARIQKVHFRTNPVIYDVPETGVLAELTVPVSQIKRNTTVYGWQPIYRLYYGSVHWVIGVEEGPDGTPWYKVFDELLDIPYLVQAEHLRLIAPEEYSPIATDVPFNKKKIEVKLATQMLYAYENDKLIFETNIASGINQANVPAGTVPTRTPTGIFNIASKKPSTHMGDGFITDDITAYELPGIPWVSFFAPHGVAFHGTYWHDNYGIPMSHGCINMRSDEALWLYRWSDFQAKEGKIETTGYGTQVTVS